VTASSEGNHFPDEGMVDFDTELDDHTGDYTGDTREPQEAAAPEVDLKVAELTADLQRLQAEYLNYKRRVDRDRELVQQNAKFAVLSSMLPVLDAIDRAREHGELHGGFKAVAESLEKVVEGLGLNKFGAPGDEFDPHHHEALMHGHSPDVTVSTCQTIVQAGYQIGDRVVRPALVTVVDPEQPEPPAAPSERDEDTAAAEDGLADDAVSDEDSNDRE
jgi:molecular chaperone GrpE